MPSLESGRRRGAEYCILGAACGRASREREQVRARALLEHVPDFIKRGLRAGKKNEDGCRRNFVSASVAMRDTPESIVRRASEGCTHALSAYMLHAYYEYSQLAALSSPSCPFCPLTPKSSQQGSGPRFLAPLTCRAPSLHLPCCMVADVVRYMITAPTWACILAKTYAEQAPDWKMAPDSNNAGIEHDPTKGRATEAN